MEILHLIHFNFCSMLGTIHSILKLLKIDLRHQNSKGFADHKFTNWFRSHPDKDNPKPLVTVKELQPKFKNACQFLTDKIGVQGIGDYLEFGVCHGTSMNCMFQTLQELRLNHVRLFGFDSFEGLPDIAAIDIENEFQPGDFASSLSATSQRLTESGIDWNRTFLIKGWFKETLNESLIKAHNIQKASLIMIDCDLYSSAKEALNFCIPLIKDTSILIIDDWSEDKNIGEKRAFKEFLNENPHFNSELLDKYRHKGRYAGRLFAITNTRL